MERNKINTILIGCDYEETFTFLAEFFMFVGIFPVQGLYPITSSLESFVTSLDRSNYLWTINADSKSFLENAINDTFGNSSFVEDLIFLANVYIKHDLVHACTYERFPYNTSKENISNRLSKFEKALEEVENYPYTDNFHIAFFILNCKRKINFVLGKLRRKKRFIGKELIKQALALVSPQGYILAGLICNEDLNYLADSNIYYEAVLARTKNPYLISFLHWLLGNYERRIVDDYEVSVQYYEKSMQTNIGKYYLYTAWYYSIIEKVDIYNLGFGIDGVSTPPNESKFRQQKYSFYELLEKILSNSTPLVKPHKNGICHSFSILELSVLVATTKTLLFTFGSPDYHGVNYDTEKDTINSYKCCINSVNASAFFDNFFGSESDKERVAFITNYKLNLLKLDC